MKLVKNIAIYAGIFVLATAIGYKVVSDPWVQQQVAGAKAGPAIPEYVTTTAQTFCDDFGKEVVKEPCKSIEVVGGTHSTPKFEWFFVITHYASGEQGWILYFADGKFDHFE